jgi:voltage-gated potassium channel
MSVITISTVGYGEIRPLSATGQLFISILIMLNIGIVAYALAVFSYYVIDGKLFRNMHKNRIKQRISQLRGHTIVCGYGKYGHEIIEHLRQQGYPFVVIEERQEKLTRLLEDDKEALYVFNDATHDETLYAAGIDRAGSLITALDDDSDNLFIVLSAKELNRELRIVSRAKEVRSRQKMIKAGASHVIMPEQIGGFYMATLIAKPGAVGFFSFIANELSADIGFEELTYDQLPDRYREHPIRELRIRSFTGVNIIGQRLTDGQYRINPSPDTILQPGESYIVIGNPEQLAEFRAYFGLK